MKGVSSLLVIPPPLRPSSWLPAAQPGGGPRENKELRLKINPLFHVLSALRKGFAKKNVETPVWNTVWELQWNLSIVSFLQSRDEYRSDVSYEKLVSIGNNSSLF